MVTLFPVLHKKYYISYEKSLAIIVEVEKWVEMYM